MNEEIDFSNLTVGELINLLEKLPKDYQVATYSSYTQMREREVTIEIFEDEKLIEIY